MSLSLRQSKQNKSKASARRPIRLQLERLEDRLAMSADIFTPNFYNGPIAPLPPVNDQISALSAVYQLTAYLPWDGPEALQSAGLQFGAGPDATALPFRSSASGPAAQAWNDIMQARSLLNQEVTLYNQQPQLGWADPNTYNGGHGTQQENQLANQAEQYLWDAYNNIQAIPTQTTGTGNAGGTGSGGNNGGGGYLQGGISWFENGWQQFQSWLSNTLDSLGRWWNEEAGPFLRDQMAIASTMGPMGLAGEAENGALSFLYGGVKATPLLGPTVGRIETAVGDWLASAGPAVSKWFGNVGPAISKYIQEFVTSEAGGAEQVTAQQLAIDLTAKYGGSVKAALGDLNQMGLPQNTVVDTLTYIFQMSGRQVGDVVTMPDGTKVLLSRVIGPGQPIIGVTSSGQAAFGTATINFSYDTMTSVASNINLPWGQYP